MEEPISLIILIDLSLSANLGCDKKFFYHVIIIIKYSTILFTTT